MFWLHFKYVNAVILFTFIVCFVWAFAKITGRENPLKFNEYKEILAEIKSDIYGGV